VAHGENAEDTTAPVDAALDEEAVSAASAKRQ
jgi:hypothetical protein